MFASNTSAANGAATYIEDVFSTYLYTGNGSTQTITNGIDLAGKGGMVWGKTRNAVVAHTITDTVRGVDKELFTNTTDAQVTRAAGTGSVYAFNSNGFSTSAVNGFINYSGLLEATWTFRKQPKFFDVVTYTGSGNAQTVPHNLGSVPGCIMIKRLNSTSDWVVYHRGLSAPFGAEFPTYCIKLNSTAAEVEDYLVWNTTAPTATTFDVAAGGTIDVDIGGATYVAYLFAHNAGGFGLTGTDNVISCGSFTTEATYGNANVNLGYEAQYVMVKSIGTGDWYVVDNMRGMPWNNYPLGGNGVNLKPNSTAAESALTLGPTPTGFFASLTANTAYIYIAIRRGPMKVPTDGTKVYKSVTRTGTNAVPWKASGAGFPPDMTIMSARDTLLSGYQHSVIDRVRRATEHIQTVDTSGEGGGWGSGHIHNMDGYDGLYSGDASYYNTSPRLYVDHHFRRAPSFFDVVCYTGTSTATTIPHNLNVVPELVIVKGRDYTIGWYTYVASLGLDNGLAVNLTNAAGAGYSPFWSVQGGALPTASVLNIGSGAYNNSGSKFVAYLFASCPGVSKVGSYTGTGTTKQINCGFTAGARFVLIKRTDSTGDWYVWDSARGIVSGNDPYLLLNSTGIEVTNTDYIDTYSAGFEISSTAPAAINASGGNFIYLAIA